MARLKRRKRRYLTHAELLEAPAPVCPPDGYIPAAEYADPPKNWEPPPMPAKPKPPPYTAPKIPEGFERYRLAVATAARIIGVQPKVLVGWCENTDEDGNPAPLFPHLRRPDGKLRFRLSDCYRAAGVTLADDDDDPPPVSPHSGDAAPGNGGPGVA